MHAVRRRRLPRSGSCCFSFLVLPFSHTQRQRLDRSCPDRHGRWYVHSFPPSPNPNILTSIATGIAAAAAAAAAYLDGKYQLRADLASLSKQRRAERAYAQAVAQDRVSPWYLFASACDRYGPARAIWSRAGGAPAWAAPRRSRARAAAAPAAGRGRGRRRPARRRAPRAQGPWGRAAAGVRGSAAGR